MVLICHVHKFLQLLLLQYNITTVPTNCLAIKYLFYRKSLTHSDHLLLLRHYPVGVLYDLYGRSSTLPWEVTVHFKVKEKKTDKSVHGIYYNYTTPFINNVNYKQQRLL